jgi:chaperonin GroEL
MLNIGMKYLAAGCNPMDLKRGMSKATDALLKKIESDAIEIPFDSDEVIHVATISANNDEELGKTIAEAFKKVGETGSVTAIESGNLETEVEVVEGLEFNRGYIDRTFCTNRDNMTADLFECYVLITDYKIHSFRQLLPILEKANKKNKPVLIISDDIDLSVLQTISLNHSQSLINVVCVKAPGYGPERDDLLEDIAIITGGTFMSQSKGVKLEDMKNEDLGEIAKTHITSDSTTIVDGEGSTEDIEARLKLIKSQINDEEDDYKRGKLIERLGKISGGVAVIYVGGHTETEVEERKLRVDDAVGATKAAIDDGIVPGGGVELVQAGRSIKIDNLGLTNKDQELGAAIILSSLKEPLFQMMSNAGISGDVVYAKIIEKGNNIGYNINTDTFEDMVKAGIIDPAKVTKSALRNASSIASMVLTTEAVVSLKIED